jgi:pyridoxal 5'-phosphate synthase glutaminase subunit Pdx2
MRIGILAVQGAFEEHRSVLQSLGADTILLRQKSDIGTLDGLILPGGESTVQGKLLKDLHMLDPLKEMINNGLSVLATCAGLILLADKISNDENSWFGTLPVLVKRNAYGRQLGEVVSVTENSRNAYYTESVSMNKMMATEDSAAAGGTTISYGKIQITANISVTYNF